MCLTDVLGIAQTSESVTVMNGITYTDTKLTKGVFVMSLQWDEYRNNFLLYDFHEARFDIAF